MQVARLSDIRGLSRETPRFENLDRCSGRIPNIPIRFLPPWHFPEVQ